ncbi:MAG: hypothetical protein ACXVQT_05790, partial [Actinomycetota bacterium]
TSGDFDGDGTTDEAKVVALVPADVSCDRNGDVYTQGRAALERRPVNEAYRGRVSQPCRGKKRPAVRQLHVSARRSSAAATKRS